MVWPNLLRRWDHNTRTCWGYTFQWTDEHLSAEERDRLKHSYDRLADDCLNRLDDISPPNDGALPRNVNRMFKGSKTSKDEETTSVQPKRDLYVLLKQHSKDDETLGRLWREVNTIPEWVDWDQIRRGQDVFYRYGGAALTGLVFQSLLGGMGATRVVETLARTGGFSTKAARRRMYETTQYILQCTRSLESIQLGGAGHTSSVRVRLLHAAVRRRILKLVAQHPDYYNVEQWGVPINDLDSIATISAFSASLIWISLPRQGLWLREHEINDYTALWRLVAHYLGTPTRSFETPRRAKAVLESLLYSEIDPSETSKILANNIIKSLERKPPSYASREFLHANARWLNGNQLANRLGLGRPSFWYWALVAGQCIFFMSMCYLHRSVPYLDRRKVATLQKIFYTMIVDHQHGLGQESLFEFKYVPQFGTTTEMGEDESSGLTRPGIEQRSLKTLVIAAAVLAVLGWFGLRLALTLLRPFLVFGGGA